MQSLSLTLVTLAAVGFAVTIAIYIHNTRGHCDFMGASINFDQMWIIAALPLTFGIGLMPGWHWGFGFLALVAGYLVIIPIKMLIDFIFSPGR